MNEIENNIQNLPCENVYGHTKKLRFILSKIAIKKSISKKKVRVLDFGCGNGSAVSRYIINIDIDYVGIDIHEPSLNYARENYSTENAHFFNAIPKGSIFDIIIYADFLEHVTDPETYLEKHSKYLEEDGVMIASVPNKYGAYELEENINRIFRIDALLFRISKLKRRLFKQPPPDIDSIDIPYNHASGHVTFFTRNKLKSCIDNAGLILDTFDNGVFFGASISGIILTRSKMILDINANIANSLPYFIVSTWLFTIIHDPNKK